MMKKRSIWKNFLALTAPLTVVLAAGNANAQNWIGGTSTDWNDASNWSGANLPNGVDAVINNGGAGSIATISANTLSTHNDIVVRDGSRLDHTAGTTGTGGASWMFIGQDNTAGTYNLANTASVAGGNTGFAQGSGSLNANGNLLIGAFGSGRTGTVRINTSGTLAVAGETFVGDNTNSVGNVFLESGTVTMNNKIFVGNNSATGTLTMSGGTLTKTGGDETFVGRDGGTGTITQTGGTITLNHNLFVGQGNGSNGTYNISGSSVLNIGRDFAIGREGGTGALNMTGGTITKTGDERFIVGHNNGVGTVTQSGGTINSNKELYIGNENASASGTYTLSGTGSLNVDNEVVVGREFGAGTLNVNGGTITTTGNGNMYIGRRGSTGTLTQTGGAISVNREFGVGSRDDNKVGTGIYNMDGGSVTVANNFFVGKDQGATGTMTMTDGTVNANDNLRIGHNQSTGTLTQSGGIVNVTNQVHIGNESNASSVGTYALSGSAQLNVGTEVVVGRDNGTGTFNLNGGTVLTRKLEGGNGSSTVNFNGGTIKAVEFKTDFITNLNSANLQSGGAVIDSNTFDVGSAQVFTGIGGITKVGAGNLTLSGTNTYTGSTTVNNGTLIVNGNNSAATGVVTVNSGAALAGVGIIGGNTIILAGGSINPGTSPGTLNFLGSLTLSGTANIEIQGLAPGTQFDVLNGDGGDTLTFGGVLALNTGYAAALGDSVQIFTNWSSFSGTFSSITGTDLGGGLMWDTSALGTTGTLTVTAVPEPSTIGLGVLVSMVLAGLRRRKNRV